MKKRLCALVIDYPMHVLMVLVLGFIFAEAGCKRLDSKGDHQESTRSVSQ